MPVGPATEQPQLAQLLDGLKIGVWFCALPFARLNWDVTVKKHFFLPPDAAVTIDTFFERLHPDDRGRTADNIQASITNHSTFDMEYRTVSPSGTMRWVRAIGTPTYDSSGAPTRFDGLTLDVTDKKRSEREAEASDGVSAYFRDVTEQKGSQATLRINDVQFQTLADSIPQLAWMAHADGAIFWYNQRWYQYTGSTPEQMEGWGWKSVHDPEMLDAVMAAWMESIKTGNPFDMVFPLRGADGIFRPFLTRVEPIRDASGAVLRWFGTNTDISSQRDAEDALRSNQERLRAALEAAATGTFRWDLVTNALDWDEALDRLFGLAPGDTVRSLGNFLEHVYPADRAAVAARSEESARTGADFEMEFRVVWADGKLRWIYDRAKAFFDESGRPIYMTGACVDITERKRFEQSLQERMRAAALAGDVGLAVTTSNSLQEMLRMCTDAVARHTGAAGAGLWTMEKTGKMLRLHASSGVCPGSGQRHAARIVATRLPLLTNEGPRESLSFAGYPLLVDGALTGVIGLFGTDEFAPETLATLGSIANTLALGIERKRNEAALRESEARKTAVLNTALDCVITIDQDSRIIEFNPAAQETFGYTLEQAIGAEMPELIMPESFRELHRRGVAQYAKSGVAPILGKRLELEGLRSDGTTFPIELAVNRIPSDGAMLFTATIRDITERKRTEVEVRQARDAAEAGNRAKSDFLASMSHELRTPLNAIIGYSEMLQEEADEMNATSLVNDLRKIHAAGRHLLSLISDVLDLSKIEAGRMELFPETFEVNAAAREVTSTIEPLVEKNGNRLVVDVSADAGSMHADLTKVRQSLFNLLSNAAKFTKNGTITLRIRPDSETGTVRLTVSDTGIGMAPDRVQQLFQPFVQLADSMAHKTGGTGLGLALTKRFCELMGGRIEVESQLGVGSQFTMILPRNPRMAEDGEGRPHEGDVALENISSQPTVLVIDDDPAARDLMQRYLAREHVNALMAASGEEGLRMAREQRCDLITLDVLMPGMDGWAVLQALKSDPATCDIPVVVVSILEDRNLGYSLGAAEFLSKPIDRDRLLNVLRRYHCENPPCPVLIVEDDDSTRHLLSTMLSRDGWRVVEAHNGVDALEVMGKEKPELIILDLMMPEMNGFEFAAALRTNTAWREIPIIVITAKDVTAEDRLRLNGQVKQILAKSGAGPEALFGEIRQMVKRVAAERKFRSTRP
jgi:PAS domain S-box-containing protein